MYSIPSYVHYTKAEGAVFVTSDLRLNKVKLSDPDIVAEFSSLVRSGGCASLSTPMTQFLHQQRLLLKEDEIKSDVQELYQIIDDTLLLTIMPTEGCNFRCPYCYEDHAPVTMSRDILETIHQYIVDQAPNFRFISIDWFGGEPTLCKDVILETSQIIQSLQKTHQFVYSASMTTNGYLLGLEDFKKYYQAGIRTYQVTLDGWNHDQTRPHVTGKGTLAKILDNLKTISALPPEEYDFQITLRHNILAGDEDYTWYNHLKDLFGKDDRFCVSVATVSDWGGETVQSLNLAKAQESKVLLKKHKDYLKSIGLKGDHEGKTVLSGVCYASYPHGLVLRADGKIEKCTVCLNHPKNNVGSVLPGHGLVIDQEKNALWCDSQLKEGCLHCKNLLSCLNTPCPKAKIVDGVDVNPCHIYEF